MKAPRHKKKRSLARLLLGIEGSIVFLFFVFFLIEYQKARSIDPLYANSYYSLLDEYILGSFVIVFASAALVDHLENESSDAS